MTTNSQLSTNNLKKRKTTKTKTKQTTRTGTESGKWTSHGGISVGSGKGGIGGKGKGKKYSKLQKARTYIQDYSIQQSFHLEWKGR